MGRFSSASAVAARKSFSAFRTHSVVRRFIQHLAFRDNLLDEIISFGQPPGNVLQLSHDQVERKTSIHRQTDLHCLINFIAAWHDHQEVDVAVRVWPTVCMRAEQDDLLRLKPLGYFVGKAADGRLWHLRPAIPALGQRFGPRLRCGATLSSHKYESRCRGLSACIVLHEHRLTNCDEVVR